MWYLQRAVTVLMIFQRPAVWHEFGSSPNESEPPSPGLRQASDRWACQLREVQTPPTSPANAAVSWVCPAWSHEIGSQMHRPPITGLFPPLTATPLPQTTLLFLPPTPQSLSARRQIWDVLFCSFEFNYLENKCFLLKNLLPDNHTAWKSDLAQWHS